MKRCLPAAALVIPVILALIISGCAKDVGKLPVAVTGCDTVTYTKHIQPLINTYCISCHGSPPAAGAPILMTYDQVKSYAALIRSTTIDPIPTPYIMPQEGSTPLPQSQKDLISCWLGNGMKQ